MTNPYLADIMAWDYDPGPLPFEYNPTVPGVSDLNVHYKDLLDDGSASYGTTPVTKHLPGRHNQRSHGRRGTASSLFRRGKAGGFTFHTASGTYPATGYAVAVPGHSRIYPRSAFTAEALVDFLDANATAFTRNPALHLGGWYDSKHDEMVLDLVEVFDNREAGILAGRERNEQAIFDLAEMEEIDTGGTGGREVLVKGAVRRGCPGCAE